MVKLLWQNVQKSPCETAGLHAEIVCRRKAILVMLDQLTTFGQRESLTIHARSGSEWMSAVSSAQSVNMLQSVTARWRCTK